MNNMSVWKRLKTADEKDTGLKLSPEDVQELMRHLHQYVNAQLWQEEMNETLNEG